MRNWTNSLLVPFRKQNCFSKFVYFQDGRRLMSYSPKITVTPEHCLQDEPVTIKVTGLKKNKRYTLTSSIRDVKGVPYHAVGHYRSDIEGCIDTETNPCLGGHYHGAFPMGLFSNIVPHRFEDSQRRFAFDVTKSNEFQLSVFSGHIGTEIIQKGPNHQRSPDCTTVHQRSLSKTGCQRIPVKSGRVRGTLHLPPGKGPFPALVDMFGVAGGLVEYRAALFASRGFATLALPYFAYDDLPQTLEYLDITYFEEAVDYILSRDDVHKAGVGVIGVSKAGDIALNMARLIPRVKATVVINSLIMNLHTPLELKDGSIMPAFVFDNATMDVYRGPTCTVSRYTNLHSLDRDECIIPVENVHGDVLYIVGLADGVSDSSTHADHAIERRRHLPKDMQDRWKVLKYPGAGHLIEPPYTPFCVASYNRILGLSFYWGGEPMQHCEAQVDSWKQILKFLKGKLNP